MTHSKWTNRTHKATKDHTGMGRWSTFQIQGKHRRIINIVCAYRVVQTKDPPQGNINTSYSQQKRIMSTKNIENPNPRQQILDDLSALFQTYRDRDEEYILMIDANTSKDYDSNNNKWESFLLNNYLFNTHSCRHDEQTIPKTYNQGNRQIDYILCTPSLVESIGKCGFFPFNCGMKATSDHRII